MAQEFYLKSRVLYEEFQKKELHYLNLERKMHSNIMWKKDLNLPLQEYLQRINQRAKESEETYKNILEKMEELDQHTDTLSLKLEKLGILQTSVTNSISPNWFQRLDLNTEFDHPSACTHNIHSNAATTLTAKSISTQTENDLQCKMCNTSNSNQPSYLLESSSSSEPHLRMKDETETLKSSNYPINSSNLLNETLNISQYLESRSVEHISLPANENSLGENLNVKHFDERNSEQKSESREFAKSKCISLESQLLTDDESIAGNAQYYVLKNNENPSVCQSVINEKSGEVKVTDGELHKETLGSKSDADSMNNEFDFLESYATNMPVSTKVKSEQDVENIKTSANHTGTTSKAKLSGKSEVHLEERAVQLNSKLNVAKEDSEASGSLSGFNSPHMSVASDSDGGYGKDSPLSASAAYQALLRNTVQVTRTPQKESGSESEDEVESALASAVQKNQVKSKTSVKQIQEGTPHQPSNSKVPDKPAKLTSGNKPQSKLSKNTRKVLGLDSSSGSEVEIAINSPKEKTIDEDSDEFGFYD